MKLWMYGCSDAEAGVTSEKGLQELKQLGFSAYTGGAETAQEAAGLGLDAYVVSGAYRGPDFTGDEWLAQDPWGRPQHWFGSTCPTRREVREYNLERVRALASTPGIKGVIIDGARFASPASGTSLESFFTCFCPSCLEKAKAMGFDVREMREAAARLYDYLRGDPVDLTWFCHGLMEWMQFRRAATTEHLVNFCRTVKEVDPSLKTGIFIFPPALSDIVGQNYRDLAVVMDFFSPMIYRCYPQTDGPACLNVELSEMLRRLIKSGHETPAECVRDISGLTGLDITGYEDPEVLQKGLDVRIIAEETSRARTMIRQKELVPILELDDPDLGASTDMAAKGGADSVSFFAFREDQIEKNAGLFRRLSKE